MDSELPAARLILELLLSSRLTKDDPLLKQAAELARAPLSIVRPRDSIRAEVSLTIDALIKSIDEGSDAAVVGEEHEFAISLAKRFIASRS
jgi:hypothetical protein